MNQNIVFDERDFHSNYIADSHTGVLNYNKNCNQWYVGDNLLNQPNNTTGSKPLNFSNPSNFTINIPEIIPECYLSYSIEDSESEVDNKKITIDIINSIVEIFDFTKKKTEYAIKKFFSKNIKSQEVNCISVERKLLPGELIELKKYQQNSEIIIDFFPEAFGHRKYGKKYVTKSVEYSNHFSVDINNDLTPLQGQSMYLNVFYGNNTIKGSDFITTTTSDNVYTTGINLNNYKKDVEHISTYYNNVQTIYG